jgi:hypothetical protein
MLLNIILDQLDRFKSSKAISSTQLSPLSSSRWTEDDCALAFLHMLLDKWLTVVEYGPTALPPQFMLTLISATWHPMSSLSDWCRSL